MNTTALKRLTAYGGPIMLGAGMTVFAVALVTPGAYDVRAAPAPTVTVTRPAAPVTVTPTSTATPPLSPAPTQPPRATATLVADRSPTGRPSRGAAGGQGRTGGVSAAGTSQSPAAPSSSCTGRVLAVQLRILPNCAVTLGGSR